MTTLCRKLLCAPVAIGKRFSSVGRHWCALRKARRESPHRVGEYALLSPRPRRQIAANEKPPRGGSEKWGAFRTNRPSFCSSFPCFSLLSRACARQVFFVFCLHRFTHPLQRYDCQHVWCEGFSFLPFTLCITPPPPSIRTKDLLFSGIVFKNPEVPNGNGRW